ncbi:MAG: FAD-dependent oxidoreductase [Eubacteriaceae bacterium]|jgi:NADPH-dependent 2,4-dienoyl-CoA reductase/sulfur reductase-like enzyme
MKEMNVQVAVIGAGPAGLAAALSAHEKGASVIIVERSDKAGGILNQCIHSGFGLQIFGEELTGPEYAERYIDRVAEAGIPVLTGAMVTDISKDRTVTAMTEDGMLRIHAGAVVLAMGCRERTRGAIKIPGDRPAGVFTAGLAQRYVNMENLKPGKRVVILGSGDIGLIMARRLTLEGIEVAGVYELMPYPNGLYRNIINCLEDFNIPLHLSTTVTRVNGRDRVESVEVARVDEHMQPIPGTEETVPCDTLLLSVGLIPENELSEKAGCSLNAVTNGPVVTEDLETTTPGIFACGNVLHVHDLADNVTKEAEQAGAEAAGYAMDPDQNRHQDSCYPVIPEKPVRYTVPAVVSINPRETVRFKFRVGSPVDHARVRITCGDRILYESRKPKSFIPSIMEEIDIRPAQFDASAAGTADDEQPAAEAGAQPQAENRPVITISLIPDESKDAKPAPATENAKPASETGNAKPAAETVTAKPEKEAQL